MQIAPESVKMSLAWTPLIRTSRYVLGMCASCTYLTENFAHYFWWSQTDWTFFVGLLYYLQDMANKWTYKVVIFCCGVASLTVPMGKRSTFLIFSMDFAYFSWNCHHFLPHFGNSGWGTRPSGKALGTPLQAFISEEVNHSGAPWPTPNSIWGVLFIGLLVCSSSCDSDAGNFWVPCWAPRQIQERKKENSTTFYM